MIVSILGMTLFYFVLPLIAMIFVFWWLLRHGSYDSHPDSSSHLTASSGDSDGRSNT